jgi:hypothetical protein
MRAARRGLEVPGELDFLGHYITRGLYFDEIDDNVYQVLLTSHTEALHDYYRHEAGARQTPAPKPAPTTHTVIAELIGQLEGAAPPHFDRSRLLALGARDRGASEDGRDDSRDAAGERMRVS